MSMNSCEINLVLQELKLESALIQQIWQPAFHTILIDFYKDGASTLLLICLRSGFTRLHASDRSQRQKGPQPRFAEMLRARLKGKHVLYARQIGLERIVHLQCSDENETLDFYVRLWGNAGNAFLCTADQTIVDCCFRRPQRNESSGMPLVLPEPRTDQTTTSWIARSTGTFPTLNAALDAHYRELERNERSVQLLENITRLLFQARQKNEARIAGLTHQRSQANDFERYQLYGDIIQANIWQIRQGQTELVSEDWTNANSSISIALDPSLSAVANAEKWYQKFRKARDSRSWLDDELQVQQHIAIKIAAISQTLSSELPVSELELLLQQTASLAGKKEQDETLSEQIGARFNLHGFTVLVGRSAQENDDLLRRHVRGNDVWLHARDHPGSYVFIKANKGKSVPLDVLLDAAHLAVWYSKAKHATAADVYYTQAKFLRRVKNGPKGLVIPTQDKNLHVQIDHDRLQAILGH